MPPDALRIQDQLKTFFTGKPVLKAELFGSLAKGKSEAGSDVDLLVTPAPGATRHELFRMAAEIEDLLQRPVDLLLRPSVEAMKNRAARELILGSAVPIYVA